MKWILLVIAICCPAVADDAVRTAVDRVAASVVRIETVGGVAASKEVESGAGASTGLVVSEDGLIVTSTLPFGVQQDSILVTLADGERVNATLVHTNFPRELVLLKVSPKTPLTVPTAAPRDGVRVGQTAIAVGRTYSGDAPNLSVGLVSATNRIYSKAIQTDAKISANNYGGPLVDLEGRVIGVLAPFAPEAMGGMSGVALYDSGIGFAVPLDDVFAALPRWREQDLRAGLLGVSLKGNDVFGPPVELAVVRSQGPAYAAGLRRGDIVVEANGKPVTRQAQFKHVLSPLYGGDEVNVVVERGEKKERVSASVKLVEKLPVFEAPSIGFLPAQTADGDKRVRVRYVIPGSVAAQAGFQIDDVLTHCDDEAIADVDDLRLSLANRSPGIACKFTVKRGEQALPVELTLEKLTADLPADAPAWPVPPAAKQPENKDEAPAIGIVPLVAPEFANKAFAYIPRSYNKDAPPGLVIFIPPAGEVKPEAFVARWQGLCETHSLALVVAESKDANQWQSDETRFIQRVVQGAFDRYSFDEDRIAVVGQTSGGALAWQLAFAGREVIRGAAIIDAPIPRGLTLPEADPGSRVLLCRLTSADVANAPQFAANGKQLAKLGHPTTNVRMANKQAPSEAELDTLCRWINALARF